MALISVYTNRGLWSGNGMLGGSAEPSSEGDGRAKIKGEYTHVAITVYAMTGSTADLYVHSTISAGDGSWSVKGIDQARKYRIVASDPKGVVAPAVHDNVSPAPLL